MEKMWACLEVEYGVREFIKEGKEEEYENLSQQLVDHARAIFGPWKNFPTHKQKFLLKLIHAFQTDISQLVTDQKERM